MKRNAHKRRKIDRKALDRGRMEDYNIGAVTMNLRSETTLNICFSRWDPISYARETFVRIMEIDRIRSCGAAKSTGQTKIL